MSRTMEADSMAHQIARREELVDVGTGSTRSKLLNRHDLVPPVASRVLAARFGLGAINHGERNWERGQPWHVILAHAEEHLLALKERLAAGLPYDPARDDDDAAAIMWAAAVVIFFERGPATEAARRAFYAKGVP